MFSWRVRNTSASGCRIRSTMPHPATLFSVAFFLLAATTLARPFDSSQVVTFSGIQSAAPATSKPPVDIVQDNSPLPVPKAPGSDSSGTNTIGIAVGCTIGILALCIISFIVVYRRRRRARPGETLSRSGSKSTIRAFGTPSPYQQLSSPEGGKRLKRPEHTLSKEWAMGSHIIMPTIVGRMEPGVNMVEMKVLAGSREAEEALWEEVDRRLRTPARVRSDDMLNSERMGATKREGDNWI